MEREYSDFRKIALRRTFLDGVRFNPPYPLSLPPAVSSSFPKVHQYPLVILSKSRGVLCGVQKELNVTLKKNKKAQTRWSLAGKSLSAIFSKISKRKIKVKTHKH